MPYPYDNYAQAYRQYAAQQQPYAQFQTTSGGGGGGAIGQATKGGAASSMFGPPGAMIGAGLGFIGGVLNGASEQGNIRRQIAEQAREFDISNNRSFELGSRGQQQSEGQQANELKRQMDMAPMRDQAYFQMMQRLGMASNPFQPNDMFNGGGGYNVSAPSAQAGIDQNLLNQRNAAYSPGAGGQMNTSLQQALLRQLGYAPDDHGQYQWQQPGGYNAGMGNPNFAAKRASTANMFNGQRKPGQ